MDFHHILITNNDILLGFSSYQEFNEFLNYLIICKKKKSKSFAIQLVISRVFTSSTQSKMNTISEYQPQGSLRYIFGSPSQTGCHGNIDNHKFLIEATEGMRKKNIASRVSIQAYFNSCFTSQVSFSVASSDLVIINIYQFQQSLFLLVMILLAYLSSTRQLYNSNRQVYFVHENYPAGSEPCSLQLACDRRPQNYIICFPLQRNFRILKALLLLDFFFFLSFFFFFQGCTCGIWKFPGQRVNHSCSCQPMPQPQQCGI